MLIQIEVRNVYGNEMIYPANDTAATFAHQERRWLWQERRGEVDRAPVALCACGHAARWHASQHSEYRSCELCDCERSREAVRAANA